MTPDEHDTLIRAACDLPADVVVDVEPRPAQYGYILTVAVPRSDGSMALASEIVSRESMQDTKDVEGLLRRQLRELYRRTQREEARKA